MEKDYNIEARSMLLIEQSDEGSDDYGLIKISALASILKRLDDLEKKPLPKSEEGSIKNLRFSLA